MQGVNVWTSIITSLSTTAVMVFAPLLVPTIRAAAAKYVAGFLQHHFDQRLERLRSDLRRTEESFRADLRASENRVNALTETALSLRSARQAALDARRLQAVEKLWTAKVGIDRWKMAALLVSRLDLQKVFQVAKDGDKRVEEFARTIDKIAGIDLAKDPVLPSAMSERPFLPANIWTLFSAYQGVIVFSLMALKVLANGGANFWKDEDTQRPIMLAALPEYQSYIEQYGVSGYYHLLDPLEQKLLNAIDEMLDGKAHDVAAVKRYGEIASMVGELSTDIGRNIPEQLRGPEVPPPPAQ